MNRKKNVLILHGSSDLYGASKILLATIESLTNDKYKVTVVLSEPGPLVDYIKKLDVEVLVCKLGILRRKYFTLRGVFNRLIVLKKAKASLGRIIIEKKIDLIYSNTTAVLIGALVAKKYGIRHLWHVHEIIKSPKLFVRFISWFLNNYSDKIIVVSDEVKKHWSQFIVESKLVTIYNGIDYSAYLNAKSTLRDELGIDKDILLIGMIGRVNLWKGQRYFLEIASMLKKKFQNVRFVLVGDAFPGYEYLYKEISEFIYNEDLTDVVYNLGYRNDIPNILNSIDIFVLPSTSPDPLPTVVLEAMASARPVIATSHGGALEMITNGEVGYLMPWDNFEKASVCFYELVENESLRQRMGRKGRERVLKHFSLKSFTQNLLTVMENL